MAAIAKLTAAMAGIAASAAAAPVRTQSDWIQRSVEGGLIVYRGIPFTAPPVGRLRWRPPQLPLSWPGVRNADRFVPSCMQGRPWWTGGKRR